MTNVSLCAGYTSLPSPITSFKSPIVLAIISILEMRKLGPGVDQLPAQSWDPHPQSWLLTMIPKGVLKTHSV
jgi:hypothetical protein